MSNPTILLTSFSFFPNVGGIENSLRYLAKSYQCLGFNVVILVSKSCDTGEELADVEEIDGITVYRYNHMPNVSLIKKFIKPFLIKQQVTGLIKQLQAKYNIVLTVSRHHTTTVYAKAAGLNNVIYLVPGVVKYQDVPKHTSQTSGVAKSLAWLNWHRTQQTSKLSRSLYLSLQPRPPTRKSRAPCKPSGKKSAITISPYSLCSVLRTLM